MSEQSISNRARNIVKRDRVEDIRAYADQENTFCVFASLHEISAGLNGDDVMPPRINKLWVDHLQLHPDIDTGAVAPSEFFEVLQRFQDNVGLGIKKITANPSFLDHFEIPDEIKPKVELATGEQSISIPHMRVMAQQDNQGAWHTHAETDFGDNRSKRRFSELKERGWTLTPMTIEFKKVSK